MLNESTAIARSIPNFIIGVQLRNIMKIGVSAAFESSPFNMPSTSEFSYADIF